MKFISIIALAAATVMAAPAVDVVERAAAVEARTYSTTPSDDHTCGDNRKQVNISEVKGVIGLIGSIGDILNQNGGGSFCCDDSAPQV